MQYVRDAVAQSFVFSLQVCVKGEAPYGITFQPTDVEHNCVPLVVCQVDEMGSQSIRVGVLQDSIQVHNHDTLADGLYFHDHPGEWTQVTSIQVQRKTGSSEGGIIWVIVRSLRSFSCMDGNRQA